MKLFKMLGAAAALIVGLALLAAQPADATEGPPDLPDLPIELPCDHDAVDCGDFPDPEDVPEGSDCTITVDGVTYEGETNDEGQCVCPDEESPVTTSTTVPETTTTTAGSTTSTTAAEETTTTTVAETTTTVGSGDTTTTLPGASAGQGGGAPFEYADCAHVARERSTPILANEPGYSDRLDNDGDGVGCEAGEAADTPDVETVATGQLPRTGSSSTGVLVAAGAGLLALGLAAVTGRRWLASRA